MALSNAGKPYRDKPGSASTLQSKCSKAAADRGFADMLQEPIRQPARETFEGKWNSDIFAL